MATQTRKVSSYRVYLEFITGHNIANVTNLDFDQWIFCIASDGKLIRLYFLTNRDTPPKSFAAPNGEWFTFFKKDQYAYCLDLLRNEMPIWISLDEDKGKVVLRTGAEPTGEGPGEL